MGALGGAEGEGGGLDGPAVVEVGMFEVVEGGLDGGC